MRQMVTLALVMAVLVPVGAQQPGSADERQVEALVMEYTRLEDAMDMQTQSKLIMPDRWWHGLGGRRTDNVMWVKVQEEGFANRQKRFPGLRVMTEVRDLRVRLLAPTVALASFVWYSNRLVPGDWSPEKRQELGAPPFPQVLSLVCVKQADGWKIASSHISPMFIP